MRLLFQIPQKAVCGDGESGKVVKVEDERTDEKKWYARELIRSNMIKGGFKPTNCTIKALYSLCYQRHGH